AFIRGLHEGEDFNRLFGADWNFSCFEEAANLKAKLFVASLFSRRHDAFTAESDRAEVAFVAANATIGGNAPVVPSARNTIGVLGLDALDGFAASAHERVEWFDAVDAVEKHVRGAFLVGTGSPRHRARHRAELFILQKVLNARSESQ